MNEQQLADLFSEQIERMLAGKTVEAPAAELSELLNLGQQLHQVRFQAGPTAQAAFQAQLAGWFGPTGAAGLGLSKGVVTMLMLVVGTGIGLVALMGLFLQEPVESDPIRVTPRTTRPVSVTPVDILPVVVPSPTSETVSPTPQTPEPEQPARSSESDTLPSFSSQRDTLPITRTTTVEVSPFPTTITPTTTLTPTPTPKITVPAGTQPDDGQDGEETDVINKDDHDRGHGNDPDRIDEDNPGSSSGAGQSSDQNKDKDKGGGKNK